MPNNPRYLDKNANTSGQWAPIPITPLCTQRRLRCPQNRERRPENALMVGFITFSQELMRTHHGYSKTGPTGTPRISSQQMTVRIRPNTVHPDSAGPPLPCGTCPSKPPEPGQGDGTPKQGHLTQGPCIAYIRWLRLTAFDDILDVLSPKWTQSKRAVAVCFQGSRKSPA